MDVTRPLATKTPVIPAPTLNVIPTPIPSFPRRREPRGGAEGHNNPDKNHPILAKLVLSIAEGTDRIRFPYF